MELNAISFLHFANCLLIDQFFGGEPPSHPPLGTSLSVKFGFWKPKLGLGTNCDELFRFRNISFDNSFNFLESS